MVLSTFNYSLFSSKYWGRQFTLMNVSTSRLSQFSCSVTIVMSTANTNCQTPVINITNKNIQPRIVPFGTPFVINSLVDWKDKTILRSMFDFSHLVFAPHV